MKQSKPGALTGFTGKIGASGLYARIVNGRAIVQGCPVSRKQKSRPASVIKQQDKFRFAAGMAKGMMKDPAIRAVYARVAKGFASPGAMFVRDYYRPAEITRLVTTGYQGQAGYKVIVKVKNLVPVKSVVVTITGPDGEILETGHAVMQKNGITWHYRTSSAVRSVRGCILQVRATDIPGHSVTLERIL
jgi:hypothetical protein